MGEDKALFFCLEVALPGKISQGALLYSLMYFNGMNGD